MKALDSLDELERILPEVKGPPVVRALLQNYLASGLDNTIYTS